MEFNKFLMSKEAAQAALMMIIGLFAFAAMVSAIIFVGTTYPNADVIISGSIVLLFCAYFVISAIYGKSAGEK